MRIPTIMGAALFAASVRNSNNWVAKQVQERATHTQQGTKDVPVVSVSVSPKTKSKIANEQGVLV
jgi:hypothetical protein